MHLWTQTVHRFAENLEQIKFNYFDHNVWLNTLNSYQNSPTYLGKSLSGGMKLRSVKLLINHMCATNFMVGRWNKFSFPSKMKQRKKQREM